METIKAVGYVRVSTAEQVEGESLDTQRRQIKEFCDLKGWELTHTYADEGKTGAKLEHRLDFKQMLDDAEAGKFNIIVIWKLSRFARNVRDYHNTMFELDKHSVSIASVKENIDPTTKTGKMIAGMIALFAEWEHETIREQMWENKMIKWKDKRMFNGKAPFGYTWNKKEEKLEINQPEADLYHRIVEMYIKQGLSMKDITIRLNNEKLTATMYRKKVDGSEYIHKPFSSAVVSYMLKNPAYYGHYVVNQFKHVLNPKSGLYNRSKELKPESEMITYSIPALISKTKWDEIQQTTKFRKVKTKNKGEFTDMFFLRDICVCGRCGSKLGTTVGNRRNDSSRPRYYSCYWASTSKKNLADGRTHKCSQPLSKAEEVEEQVWNGIMAKFGILGKGKQAFEKLYDASKYESDINNLKQTIERFSSDLKIKERAKKRIYTILEDEEFSGEDLKKKLRENTDEILTLKSKITDSEQKLIELSEIQKSTKALQDFAVNNQDQYKQFRKELRELSLPDKKLLMEAWVKGKITVHYNEDEDEYHGVHCDYKTQISNSILERFVEEGKLSQLNKNSSGNYSSHDIE